MRAQLKETVRQINQLTVACMLILLYFTLFLPARLLTLFERKRRGWRPPSGTDDFQSAY